MAWRLPTDSTLVSMVAQIHSWIIVSPVGTAPGMSAATSRQVFEINLMCSQIYRKHGRNIQSSHKEGFINGLFMIQVALIISVEKI